MRLSRVLPALAIASTMAFTSPAWAMPATPKAVVVHQPDGTAFKLFIRGNAHFNWYEDMQGYTVVQSNGTFFYAKLDANGKLVASPLLAGESKPADAGLVPYILPTDEIRLANANHQEAVHNTTLSNMKLAGLAPGTPALGTVKNLVVLCRFSDQTAASGRLQAEYNTIFNATGGDPVLAPTGSVKDYYLAASYGQLTLNSTVTVWVTLPHTEAYYANGNTGDSYKDDEPTYPKNVAGMTEDALNAVAALSGNDKINFKDFDANNDGFIDCISIVHSGYGAETGTNKNQVWSQKNDLSQLPGGKWTSPSTPGNLNGDGVPVSVFDFHTEPALNSTTGTDICRIGVIIHETGHFFGLPDLYDHGGKSSGLGSYCLMANSWGWDNEGNRPSIPSAWCRVKLGWTIPQIITSGTFSAPQVETIKDNSVFKITQGFPAGEYLLVENRQPVGSDSQIPQGGLAIWHVDDKVQGNDNVGFPGQAGWPTNGKHYQVAMLQADGLFNLEKNDSADEGDLYRAGGHTAVTPTTTPNTKTYQDGVVTDSKNSITNISATGATMTFTLNASALGAPVITSAGTAPGTVGTAFSYQITATNSPTIFSATGLPAGFTLNASTGVITATPAATVNATATIKATNGTGTGSASLIISVVPAPPTLAQALDAAAFNWTSTTSPPWVGEKTVTHDGIDAAASGPIRVVSQDGVDRSVLESNMQTSITGPGVLKFWWKVSSEQDYDLLHFDVDGTENGAISGEVDWVQRSVSIPTGTHVVRWRYTKDRANSAGLDQGFVDQVSFMVSAQPPAITSALTATGFTNQAFSYQVTATNSPTTYATTTTLPTGLTLKASTGVLSGTPTVSGIFPISITATSAAGTSQAAIVTLTLVNTAALATATDAGANTWKTGGSAPWFSETTVTHDGTSAVQSGAISDDQESWIETTFTDAGTLTFWWQVSSEQSHDFLRCMVDGVEKAFISGPTTWALQSLVITGTGTHTVRWRYTKDGSVANGTDAGWLDAVSFGPATPEITSGSAIEGVTGSALTYQIVTVNDATSYTATTLPAGLQFDGATGLIHGTPTVAGSTTVTLGAANGSGTGHMDLTIVITAAGSGVVTLPAALDTPGRIWTSGGDQPWTGETTKTHDDVDAAQSGAITDNQTSTIETIVTGPGVLTYFWSVSSEKGYDFLRQSMDDVDQAAITGTVDWIQRMVNIPSGDHVVRWTYAKDDTGSDGTDQGWLDQVSFVAGPIAPIITSSLTATGQANTPFSYQITAVEGAVSYSATGLPAGLSVNSATGLISGIPSMGGSFVVTLNATSPVGTGTMALNLFIGYGISLPVALNAPSMVFTTAGTAGWYGQPVVSQDHISAAQSQLITDGQDAGLQTTVTGPGVLTYYWQVSSEKGYDFLELHLDDAVVTRISGTVAWQKKTINIPAGDHAILWRYAKDEVGSGGSDAAWVDQVSFIPLPQFSTQPQSVIGGAATAVQLSAEIAGGQPISLQWMKNGKIVPGATSSTLSISSAKLTDAGTYTLRAANAAGTSLSDAAEVAVVDLTDHLIPAKIGTSGILSIAAAGNGLSYEWQVADVTLTPDNLTLGVFNKTLTLKQLAAASSGDYACVISTDEGLSIQSGKFHLAVYTAAPIVQTLALPQGDVSAFYQYQVLVDDGDAVTPAVFSATGLPKGLKINSMTGLISGIPTIAANNATVTVKATNGFGPSSQTGTITILVLSPGSIGAFQGLVARDDTITAGLGSRIELNSTATGSFSGRLITGSANNPFAGTLDNGVDPPEVHFSIARTGESTLTVDGTLDPDGQTIAATVTDPASKVSVEASLWRNAWLSTPKPVGYGGSYNFAFGPVINGPDGFSFGSFKVPATGVVTVAGKLADGTAFGTSTFVGPEGQVLIYQPLYSGRGSVTGKLQIITDAPSSYANNHIEGALTWTKTRSPSNVRDYVYVNGFASADMPVTGGLYRVPATDGIVLDFADADNNVNLAFNGGGLDQAALVPDLTVTVASVAQVVTPSTNDTGLKLSVTSSSGAFTGSFTLTDDPFIGTNAVVRAVKFYGILISDNGLDGSQAGYGYFVLPQIPVAGQTLPPQLSGSVQLEAAR